MTNLLPQLQATLGDDYVVERELVGDGAAHLFVARERTMNRALMIKVLSAEQTSGIDYERFADEMVATHALQQANIVPVISFGRVDGIPFMTMPFSGAASLRQRLAEEPPLTLAEGVGILRDIARALSHANQLGIVHRDIRPDNVMLSQGLAVVTDFGIANALIAAQTTTRVATGTPAYTSPEQVSADAEVDQRADIYAWGCVAYEIFAGAPPFVRDSTEQVLSAHLNDDPVPISLKRRDLPATLVKVIMRCLAKDPANRPRYADNLIQLLEGLDAAPDRLLTPPYTPVVSDEPSLSKVETTATPRPGAQLDKRRVLGLVGAVAGALAVAYALMQRTPAPRAELATPVAAIVVVERSVAVLPFTTPSKVAQDQLFSAGISEEIARTLSRMGVRVIGRSSAAAFAARGLDDRAIARELGVSSLLAGTVQRASGQVQITVELRGAGDHSVRWTQRYDRPSAELFAVNDEVARRVAATLNGVVSGLGNSPAQSETGDSAAHANVLYGQAMLQRGGAVAVRQAVTYFARATVIDSNYARAHASLAQALTAADDPDVDSVEAMLNRAAIAARRAIVLDSTIAEAYAALAYVSIVEGDNREAERLFRRSLALDSTASQPWALYGVLGTRLGDYAQAHTRLQRAIRLDPALPLLRYWDAQALLAEGKVVLAEQAMRSIHEADTTLAFGQTGLAEALLASGRATDALPLMRARTQGKSPAQDPEAFAMLAYAHAEAGDQAASREVLLAIRDANRGNLPAQGTLAATLASLGDVDSAIGLLGTALQRHDVPLALFSRSPRYRVMRADPRGEALLAGLER